jgi:hypothetical protein
MLELSLCNNGNERNDTLARLPKAAIDMAMVSTMVIMKYIPTS